MREQKLEHNEEARLQLLGAFDRACAQYNGKWNNRGFCFGFLEFLYHSNSIDASVVAFGESLKNQNDYYRIVVQRLRTVKSDWSSPFGAHSFNSYFLDEIKSTNFILYKKLVEDAFNFKYLVKDKPNLILYRGDSRPSQTIFYHGFALQHGILFKSYATQECTGTSGVSTTRKLSVTYDFGRYFYKINVKDDSLLTHFETIDIDATLQQRYGYKRGIKEMNFMNNIPSHYIEGSCNAYGNIIRYNPDYTGVHSHQDESKLLESKIAYLENLSSEVKKDEDSWISCGYSWLMFLGLLCARKMPETISFIFNNLVNVGQMHKNEINTKFEFIKNSMKSKLCWSFFRSRETREFYREQFQQIRSLCG